SGGEIAGTNAVAQARAHAHAGAANAGISGSAITGLVALGQPVTTGTTVPLADWGSLTTVASAATGSSVTGYRGSVTALEIRLTADHLGLPAGTSILVGYAEVAAQAAPPEPSLPTPRAGKKSGPASG